MYLRNQLVKINVRLYKKPSLTIRFKIIYSLLNRHQFSGQLKLFVDIPLLQLQPNAFLHLAARSKGLLDVSVALLAGKTITTGFSIPGVPATVLSSLFTYFFVPESQGLFLVFKGLNTNDRNNNKTNNNCNNNHFCSTLLKHFKNTPK